MESDSLVVGIKQSLRSVEAGKAEKAYVARDAESSVTDSFVALCEQKNVPVNYVDTMQELGKMCSISVGASVAVKESI